ncbi:pilus assembly PilX N-terminal domain-containing protein [Thermus albus]|uniref:pilus assembly PilX N-terminal domain-containing protein n=1 Tax=Thermus albus TaxID=2908146 RepID=UPI001FA9995D|nr:pilus assembly PilX N-terminal domain-containing protein [Thermus albus]
MRKGIATPIVLIVLLVVFSGLLAATSYMALGALKGSAVERGTYQAFLVAESALDAFPVLAEANAQPNECGRVPQKYVWNSLTAIYYVNDEAVPNDGQPILYGPLRLRAEAEYANAKARVERAFRGCNFPIKINAAVSSLQQQVKISGDVEIVGEGFGNGLLPRAFPEEGLSTVSLPNGNLTVPQQGTFELALSDPTATQLIPLEGYIQILTGSGPKTYKVKGKRGNTLTLELIHVSDGDIIENGAKVALVEYGVRSLSTDGKTLHLTTVVGLVQGQKAKIILGNEAPEVTISNVDTQNKTISIEETLPSIPEGTPLAPQIVAVDTKGSIKVDGKAQVSGGTLTGSDSLLPSTGDELFMRVFGVSKTTFQNYYGITKSFNGTLNNGEIKVLQGEVHLSGNDSLCGEGILVVFGNLTVNGTCRSGFKGLIYVTGDYNQQGNAVIRGAIIAEGQVNSNCTQGGNQECRTDITGTGQEEPKVFYDPLVLAKFRSESLNLTPLSGTWRRL